MEKRVSIIGGDLRIVNLAKILAEDGFQIYTFAMENAKDLLKYTKINFCDTLDETIDKTDLVISSIPLSQDGVNIVSKYSNEGISLSKLANKLTGKKFIAGRLIEEIKNNNLIESCDILQIEEYAILNAIATAEGAIQIAMEEYPKTLSGSNILIMGFGRIGKILSKMLQGIGANVYCEARKNEDLAYIKAYGYIPIHLNNLDENLYKFDIIINNIPVQILDKNKLDLVKKDVCIIDLASQPGGIDFDYAKSKNIKVVWALGLPGKVAPLSAAEYIKDTIYNII